MSIIAYEINLFKFWKWSNSKPRSSNKHEWSKLKNAYTRSA
jgi:hypothetical protein